MKNLLNTVATIAVFTVPQAVAAQTTNENSDSANADEPTASAGIVVTAQRREEGIQDVPVAVSAFGEQLIAERQIETLEDYGDRVPSFRTSIGFEDSGISIRGVTNIGGQASSVVVYQDEIGIGDLGAAFNLFDVERIEVLRGPQGTLFGRNTIAGAVNIVLNTPDDDFGIIGDLEFANGPSGLARAVVNLPIADGFAVRFGGYGRISDGFLTDINGASQDDLLEAGGRFAARLTTGRLTLDASVMHFNGRSGLPTEVPTGAVSVGVAGVGFPVGIDDGQGFFPENRSRVSTNLDTERTREFTNYIGRAEFDFDFATLILLAGYQTNSLDLSGEDFDRTATDFIVVEDRGTFERLQTYEARLQSPGDGQINWLVGVARNIDRTGRRAASTFRAALLEPVLIGNGLPQPVAAAIAQANSPFLVEDFVARGEIRSIAGFGQIGWTSEDERFSIDVSGRYTRDRVFSSLDDQAPGFGVLFGAPPAPIGLLEDSEVFEAFQPRVTVSFQPNDNTNFYASVSRGYKAGGFNLNAQNIPNAPTTFGEETAWNYEIGAKLQLLDRALTLNMAAYQLDWTDIQVRSLFRDPDTLFLFTFTQNAAKARIRGIEVEATARPADGLEFGFVGAWNDANFVSFPGAVAENGLIVDATGDRIPRSTEWQFALTGEYEHPIDDGIDAFISAEYFYASDFTQSIAYNSEPIAPGSEFGTITDRINIGSTDFFNFRAGFRGERVSVFAFAENIGANEVFELRVDNYLSGFQAVIRPERYGVRISFNY
ncbi:TonB-dependent receptor [Parasphingopyxis sp.]|uniref:TonB-dependent receptor n=1 Tax=Parasphingopyxis sp. TaxID=1920299 RepID=UPI00260177F6|nr:TonB-dependent receptor [Parasphingopyxis sp.]